MSTLYTINVTNNSMFPQTFYFFQKPAVYQGGQIVFSNSIYSAQLAPNSTSGSILSFKFLQQFYAGAQTSMPSLQVGQASGFTTAAQAIDLTPDPDSATANNTTNLGVDPMGLTKPIHTPGVQPGAFRIITPTFNPIPNPINIGLAISNVATGTYVLSNFIRAQPQFNVDCQPVVKFYVATGGYKAGDVINYSTSSAGSAECDATQGITTFNVTYEVNGSWKVSHVTGPNATLYFPGLTQHAIEASSKAHAGSSAPMIDVEILNEAGTGVIATGQANNMTLPIAVTNIDTPNAIVLGNEYQVRGGGTTVGGMCTAKNGNSATFA